MRPGSVSSGRTSIRPPIRTARADRDAERRRRRRVGAIAAGAAQPARGRCGPGGRRPPTAAAARAGRSARRRSGGAPMSIPASLVMVRGISFFASMGTQPSKALETFPNPKPERDYVIRFDCPEFTCVCPKTGPARLRDHPRRVRPRRALRRAQVLEALPLVVPRRGRVPRGGHQPDPRRPRGRRGAAAHRGGGRLQRARRHHDHGAGHPPQSGDLSLGIADLR